MNGLLSKVPYPHDTLENAFVVQRVGVTFVLAHDDASVKTQQSDGSYKPAKAGDVLSRTTGKSWEARPAGTSGPWEQSGVSGSLAAYCSDGQPAHVEEFRYAAVVPNV